MVPQLVGIAGFALALAAGSMALTVRLAGHRRWSSLVGVAAIAAVCLPIGNIPAAGYLRGVLGDLSITSVLVLAAAAFTAVSGRSALDDSGLNALCLWAAVAGLVLYPQTLGVTHLDPYELGFRPRALILVTAALAIWWWWRQRGAALVLSSGVAAFHLRVLESENLWDYLLDPYFFLWGTAHVAGQYALGGRVRALARDVFGRAPVPARPMTGRAVAHVENADRPR